MLCNILGQNETFLVTIQTLLYCCLLRVRLITTTQTALLSDSLEYNVVDHMRWSPFFVKKCTAAT